MPERKSKLPTRLACGNAPTGSGARELSNVLLISSGSLTADYTDKHGFLKCESDSQQSTLNCCYPPAIAPMMKNGSAPFTIASGRGAFGGSCEMSSPQA